MDKIQSLPKEELIELIKVLYEDIVTDPRYKIYTKSFFKGYLKNILEVYKRYENLKINIMVCKFNVDKIDEIKKHLRKSDLIVKYDNLLVVLLFQTIELGLLKVKKKLEVILNENCQIININIKDSVENIIKKIDKMKNFI
jgi:MoaA/NifB/PqqE/SkfB family radical SAM enzyme